MLVLAHLLAWLSLHLLVSPEGRSVMDVAVFDRLMLLWTLSAVVGCLGSLPAAFAGRDAPWTAYLLAVPYTAGTVGVIYVFGTVSSVYLGFIPVIVLISMMFWNPAVGWFSLAWMLLLLIALILLQSRGVIPYAPGFLDRSLDAQQDPTVVLHTYFGLFMTFLLAAVTQWLLISARRLQEYRLNDANRQLERSHHVIRRYVPSQLAEGILAGRHTADAHFERRNLTIFFSDVEGFTNASDELDPEQLAILLNEYLAEMTVIGERHCATISQFVGDGIMIFFGAPTATNDKDHALRAVRMALEMQERMVELQQAWFKRGFQRPFRIRIGINTGYASVGDYGSQGRAVYSAIGIQTNLAARIQAQCEPGKVLVSHSTWALIHDEIPCESRGELQAKGIHYPVKVYEVQ